MATTNTTLALLLAARAVEAGDIISGRNGTASHRPSFGSQRLPGSLEYVLTRAPLEGSLDPAGGRSLFGVGQPAAFANHNIIMSRSFENAQHQLSTIGSKRQDPRVALATNNYYSLNSHLEFVKRRSENLLLQTLVRSQSLAAPPPMTLPRQETTVPAVVSTAPSTSNLKYLRSTTDESVLSSDQEDDNSLSTTMSLATKPRKRKPCAPLRGPPYRQVTISVQANRKKARVGPLAAPPGRLCNSFPSVTAVPSLLPEGTIQTPKGVVTFVPRKSGPSAMATKEQRSRWVVPLQKGITTTLMP